MKAIDVVRRAAHRHGVDLCELRNRTARGRTAKTASIVEARREASLKLLDMGLSLTETARMVGLKDHTSVLAYKRQAAARRSAEPIEYPDLSGEWAI